MIIQNYYYNYLLSLFFVFGFAQDNNALLPPVFSLESGFYNENQTLVLSHPNPDAQIVYTFDGSEPDINNLNGTSYYYKNQYPQYVGQTTGPLIEKEFLSYDYSSPIILNNRSTEPNNLSLISSTYQSNPNYFPNYLLKKAHTIRAKAYHENNESNTLTKTYFVSPSNEFNHTLPIINITTNPAYLFDYEEGIYVAGKDFDDWRIDNPSSNEPYWGDANYKRRGIEYEIPSNFQYFENQQLNLNQDIGARIHGGFSRNSRSKSLRLYARSVYDDQNSFNHSFFENNHNSFKRLVLRNSGNDFYNTYFRDALMQGIVKNLSFDTQDYQPAITYLNGEYWGLLNMRERYDHHYIKRVYGIDEDDLDLLYFNGFVDYGDNSHYFDLFNFFESNNLNDANNYNFVQTQMDIENFSDYFISNIFFDNRDWPSNNIKYFRKKTNQYIPNAPLGHDGRWRWLILILVLVTQN